MIKPAADPIGSDASLHMNGSQIAFQVADDPDSGEIWVYHGNDHDANAPQEWLKTAGTFSIPQDSYSAGQFVRITVRQDYSMNRWDLFIDGKLVAVNLGFQNRAAILQDIDFFGSATGDTWIDEIEASATNMLFTDADKDGINDAWETANGGSASLYDRDVIDPSTGKSLVDAYMDSLWSSQSINGSLGNSSVTIPPLTIDTEAPHTPVTSLKGGLSVAGDGSAAYGLPIDLPKGIAGMEPGLALNYSSAAGLGVAGLGWNLSGLQQITRGPSSVAKDGFYDPVDFDTHDRFFLDGERLICVGGAYGAPGSVYRTEIDSFARITAVGTGPLSWKVETKAGLTMFLGETSDSRLGAAAGILSWGVNRVEDSVGNFYDVQYDSDSVQGLPFDSANHRVSVIRYTGNDTQGFQPQMSVRFDYEDRPEVRRGFSTHAGVFSSKRLSDIRVLTGAYENHRYSLEYTNSYQSRRWLLTSVTQHVGGETRATDPVTYFRYDGITSTESLWQNPGPEPLPVYGEGLDASGTVNSMADVSETDPTMIRLFGDVARAFPLPGGPVTLQSDTRINFEFRSLKQVSGALIGLDNDTSYQDSNSSALFRLGGTGTIALGSGQTFTRNTQPYSVSDWKTFDFNLSQFGVGSVRGYLVLMCVDNDISDGSDSAFFRNVRIYRSGSQTPASVSPVNFDIGEELPHYANAEGEDLGVVSLDLNSDGLPDLADWRVVNYRSDPGGFMPEAAGYAYLNRGGEFEMNLAARPPMAFPLSCRGTDTNSVPYASKHRLLARPIDVNGDGSLDLMGSDPIQAGSGFIRNDFTFQTSVTGAWTSLPQWDLPFYLANVASSEPYGGSRRDEHFEWADLNTDGFPDLVIHTTASGRLYDKQSNALIIGGNARTAYLNKGKNGPGWIRDDSYALPEPLSIDGLDLGRRMIDINGDGVAEIVESSGSGTSPVRHTYMMNSSGSCRWNSSPGLQNPPASSYDLPASLVYSDGNTTGAMLVDLNGDGLPDLLRSNQSGTTLTQTTWLNYGSRGNFTWIPEATPSDDDAQLDSYRLPLPLYVSDGSKMIPFGHQFADINGDGLVDVMVSDMDNPVTTDDDNMALINSGNGWVKRSEWGLPGNQRIFLTAAQRTAGKRNAKLEDVNGDGYPDLINGLLDRSPRVWINNCRPEVLISVEDGFGAEIEVEYKRLNDPSPIADPIADPIANPEGFHTRVYEKATGHLPYGHAAIIDSRLVVSRYSEPDAVTGPRWRSQRYGDLRYDRLNEASLGFGWIEALDEFTGQISRTETSRTYPTGGSPVLTTSSVQVVAGEAIPALHGVTQGWKCLSSETASYAELPSYTGVGGTIRRPVQIQSVKTLCDLTETPVSVTTTTQNLADFDSFGFVKKSTVTSLDGSAVTTASTYHPADITRWHLGRLSQTTVTKSAPGKTSITKKSGFTYDPVSGLLQTETIEPGHAKSVTTTYGRDGFGNVTSTQIASQGAVRSSATTYHASKRFVQRETDSLGNFATFQYDAGLARLEASTDAAGLCTSFEYDHYGTLTRTYHPDGSVTGESTGRATNANLPAGMATLLQNHPVKFFRATQSSGSPVSKVYLDAQGRELVSETSMLRDATASGASRYGKVYSITDYDPRARKRGVSASRFPGEVAQQTTFEFDLLDRTIKTTHPDGSSDYLFRTETVSLDGQPVTHSISYNRASGMLKRWEDQHGRLIQSQDPSGAITKFAYDVEGRLLTVHIGTTLLLQNEWDLFGNKTSVVEANSGTSSSEYNGFGELVSTTNANGATTNRTYDDLGRLETVTRPGFEGTFTYSYHSSGGGKGQLAQISGPDGYLESFSYDSLGRPRSTTKTQFNETFTTATYYDALGRPSIQTDAGGLTVVHEYDPVYSFPVALRIGLGSDGAGTLLWQAGTFDSKGRALTQTLAQDVTTSASYHPTSGLLATMNASRDGSNIQSKSYGWDSMGNLTSRNDFITARGETFTYDDDGLNLNRVTGSTVATLPGFTSSTVPPPAAYTYAPNGNLLSKPGLSNVVYGGPRPHAVTSAKVKGVTRSYAYNDAGYVTSDGRRSYTWTSFGQLSSLDYPSAPALQNFAGIEIYAASQVQCNFDFDAAGSRARQIKQRIAADQSRKLEETLYLGSYERELHMSKASASATPVVTRTVHRHSLGGFAVYTKMEGSTGSNLKLSTLLKDHLGSTDLILTGQWNGSTFTAHETERQSFDPWGERRAADTFVTYRATDSDPFRTSAHDYDRGYTGHEQLDDSGLIHMNGRIYDPELGRMLSPDPVVQVPEYSQNFNRYSYVMNNPLNMTDPTGFSWISKLFHKVGHWLKQNWRTVAAITVGALLMFTPGGQAFLGGIVSGIYTGITGAATIAGMSGSVYLAGMGAVSGGIMGGLNSALAGGDAGDVLRGIVIGAVQGAIASGPLHALEGAKGMQAAHIAGHGILGGATNSAMGGKFRDGFLSGASGAVAGHMGLYDKFAGSGAARLAARTSIAGVVGGTAAALGGGKFANGAWTASFQHLLNAELNKKSTMSEEALQAGADDLTERLSQHLSTSPRTPFELSRSDLNLLSEIEYRKISLASPASMGAMEYLRFASSEANGQFLYGNSAVRFKVTGMGVYNGIYAGSEINYISIGMTFANMNPIPRSSGFLGWRSAWHGFGLIGDHQAVFGWNAISTPIDIFRGGGYSSVARNVGQALNTAQTWMSYGRSYYYARAN